MTLSPPDASLLLPIALLGSSRDRPSPRIGLLKSSIDALAIPPKETVLWDDALPGFGLKVTPRGKKVFIVLCRTGGAGSALRKYTIGPYGRVTLHAARAEAQKILAARLEGRDPAAEKQHKRKKLIADQVSDVVEACVRQHVSQRRSAREIERLLTLELVGSGEGAPSTASASGTSSS